MQKEKKKVVLLCLFFFKLKNIGIIELVLQN